MVEILGGFQIFIVCVFFMPLVLGYAEHVDVPSVVTALGTRRIEYGSRTEIVPSASKFNRPFWWASPFAQTKNQ